MMAFSSLTELDRLNQTHPAQPVITKLADCVFSDTQPVTIALMEPHDTDHPLAELCNAEDVTLEGILQQQDMFLVVLQTNYGYGIVFVVPDAEWLSGSELQRCIQLNLKH